MDTPLLRDCIESSLTGRMLPDSQTPMEVNSLFCQIYQGLGSLGEIANKSPVVIA